MRRYRSKSDEPWAISDVVDRGKEGEQRRWRARWSEKDRRLYQHHGWRSEGFHGEAKTWHGLGRAVRRGLDTMKIRAYLTAAAVNLKRLAAAVLAVLWAIRVAGSAVQGLLRARHTLAVRHGLAAAADA